jgi:hypothetical protein
MSDGPAITVPASLAISTDNRERKGRGLSATKSFQPGGLIAHFVSPAIVLSDGANLSRCCNHCLAVNKKVRACTRCKLVTYCGTECQKTDWTLIHSKECKVFQKVMAKGQSSLPTPVRALVQVLLRDDLQENMRSLVSNVDKFRLDKQLWAERELMALGGLALTGKSANSEAVYNAMEILFKARIVVHGKWLSHGLLTE